jgi:hypothetical protein
MRATPDLLVLGEDNPAALPNLVKPFYICGILAKMVIMNLHVDACLPQSIRNGVFSQAAIKKKGKGG